MNGNPTIGIEYFIQGLKILNKPGIRFYVIIPLIINISLFSFATYYCFSVFSGLLATLLASIPSWLSFIEWILWPLFVLTLGTIIFFISNLIANMIASPFNGILAEKVEEYIVEDSVQETSSGNAIKEIISVIPASIGREIQKLKYYLPRFIVLAILSFIPGVNILVFVFAAWMMAIQYVDYPMDNNKILFSDMLVKLRSQRLSSLSFGAVIMFSLMIPVLNFIVIPAAVAGATLFWVKELKQLN